MTEPQKPLIPAAPIEVTAACGAYLLVAFADARVATIEEARFLGGVVNDPAFKPFTPSELADEYTRLLASLGADYDAAEKEILRAVESVKRDKRAVEAVKVAARHAVIADQALKPQEDLALARLARALGVDPKDL
ncbi:MAG: tellurite resistance TerB family protein [Parvularculaceae bacterium]|nr:tellurite resistance TerB family protein [Parvularculaceae bacterium]